MSSIKRTVGKILGGGLLLLLLTACDEQSLYSGLSEQEANEIVAELDSVQIKSTKQRGKEGDFTVLTDADSFSDAVRFLKNRGLPAKRFDSLADVFDGQNLASSSTEQRARLNYALSQEISSTLSSIDGVVLARVHLAIPQSDVLNEKLEPASASVFIKHRKGMDLNSSVSSIKALVVNGIENLPYENVTVALFPAGSNQSTQTGVGSPVLTTPKTVVTTGNSSRMAALFPVSGMGAGVIAMLSLLFVAALAVIRYRRSRHT